VPSASTLLESSWGNDDVGCCANPAHASKVKKQSARVANWSFIVPLKWGGGVGAMRSDSGETVPANHRSGKQGDIIAWTPKFFVA
jgi:hypothetical protein